MKSRKRERLSSREVEQLEKDIVPSEKRLDFMLELSIEGVNVAERCLKDIARRLEWQFDERNKSKKSPYVPEPGTLRISNDSLPYDYELYVPLIRKRVGIKVSNQILNYLEYLLNEYHRYHAECYYLSKMLGKKWDRENIVGISNRKRK